MLPHLERRVRNSDRFLLGLVGPPGAGKSVLAAAIARAFTLAHAADTVGTAGAGADAAIVVGMDGFHLRQRELVQRRLQHVKGAPETFDAEGFVQLLQRLRHPRNTVKAPQFDRAIEEPSEAAITVNRQHRLVIVEGNYLLLDGPWAPVRDLLDEIWYLDLPNTERVPLLVGRHISHGRTQPEATEWVHRSDEANARLVMSAAHRADATLALLTGHLKRSTTTSLPTRSRWRKC